MNKITFQYLLIIFSLLACQQAKHNKVEKKVSSDLVKGIYGEKCDEYMTALTDLGQFNGVMLIEKQGEIILKKAYNLSQNSDSSLFVTTNSQFDLRSIAKLFGKASIVKLEQAGKLKRTDFINKYFPDFPRGSEITIEHLMHNQSGLPREFSDVEIEEANLTKSQFLKLAAQEALEFEPGTDERYSNIGFKLLYYLIGEVSGKSYDNYLFQNFFEPLKMIHSGSHFGTSQSNLKNYAYGHYLNDEKQMQSIKQFPLEDSKVGHLYSSIDDLRLFLNHLGQEPFLSALSEEGSIGHAGGTQGKRAYVHKNFDEDYSIVFLANFDGIPFQQITQDIARILEDAPYEVPKKVNRKLAEVSPEVLSKYVGTYDFVEADHLKLIFKLENHSLVAYQNGEKAGILYPESNTVFFWDQESSESIVFIAVEEGVFKAIMDFKGAKWEGTFVVE